MSAPTRVTVGLQERSYDILVGPGLLKNAAQWIAPVLASPRVIIVTDDTVSGHYLQSLQNQLIAQNIRVESLSVTAGESAKSWAVLEWLAEGILALTPDRKTTIIALGGGVIGDLAGFAASILLRGLPFIQIPTTLLAQVDSSVGGKTAINTKAGKNLIGSFYQPKLVLADTDTFATLPLRERRAGYAEIIKYGLIMDAEFYRWCLTNAEGLLAGDVALLQYAISACCRMKADIVGADERESDRRALLNLGHTFGHAFEAEAGYGETLLHGEAVAIGMVMACRLSEKMGLIDGVLEQELTAHLKQIGLPALPSDIAHPWNADTLARHFASDKKAENGALTFVLLDALGAARTVKSVNPELAHAVVASFLEG